ncbi:major facilitator superfamily domain-containing protein [Pseudoneurospora amorphoporcata]|uniref:Major facilitator superfamily domain-containing protein n=1 Tax=Pseudoneurospora amorphoporcata TaxID=241081 RepID=A0AAN6SH39_9PEZI|nr:major facilitator superfamily domain-containing protein [Pseudoneurospora amorphoporcata]
MPPEPLPPPPPPPPPMTRGQRLFALTGLPSLLSTPHDALLIILNRTTRMLSYGASSLILALFFSSLNFSDSQIGLFMTLTLLGDVVLSLLLTLVADRLGRRRTLLIGAVMMIASGIVFATCENYFVLLVAAVVGVISATGGDFGPFRAIEESMVSELTGPETRAEVLGWYVAMSSAGSCAGTAVAGRVVQWLLETKGWEGKEAYHAVFWGYVAMGVVNVLGVWGMTERCELGGGGGKGRRSVREPVQVLEEPETEPLLAAEAEAEAGPSRDVSVVGREEEEEPKKEQKGWYKVEISRSTLSVMLILWALLMIDCVADGMVSMSLTTYYMDQKFHLPKSMLGDFLSVAYFLAALSSVFAGPMARHIGLVNTMVFTHIPSSAAVLFFPLPKNVTATFALLLVRVGLNNMDQAPRAALIAAVVKPEERTAVMGITGTLRTLASTMGPSITGVLADGGRFWVAFVVAGALRLTYDLGIFTMFINIKLNKHEQQEEGDEQVAREGNDEEEEEEDLERRRE